jgi:hypothetical protein
MTPMTPDTSAPFYARRRVGRSAALIGAILGVATVGGVLISRSVRAGEKSKQEIVITGPDSTMYGTMTAQGSIGSARNSADGVQFIGCDFGMAFGGNNNPNYPQRTGGCAARDATGHSATCWVPDGPNWDTFVHILSSMGPTPYISFTAIKDQYGQYTCSAMHVYSHSDHMVPSP